MICTCILVMGLMNPMSSVIKKKESWAKNHNFYPPKKAELEDSVH